MPAPDYGASLPSLTVNLVVRSVPRSLAFYREVFGVEVRYSDDDFAALRVGGIDFMLHADHTYDRHPWYPHLVGDARRGLGAEIRWFGTDPGVVEARARAAGAVIVQPATDKGHGWRETLVEDPDGYVWAVGNPITSEAVPPRR